MTDEDCIENVIVFLANCVHDKKVHDEVGKLWADWELTNDVCYFSWNAEDYARDYPLIDGFLKSRGVTKCLIHLWW